jgi:hypothetical protein
MSERDATGDDEIRDLPEKKTANDSAADGVKGGMTPSAPSPVPIPYPNVKPANPRVIVPCV